MKVNAALNLLVGNLELIELNNYSIESVGDDKIVKVAIDPKSEVTVRIMTVGRRAEFYVNFKHENGDLICFPGTPVIESALFQLGYITMAIDCINRRSANV